MWSNYVYVKITPTSDLIFDEVWEKFKIRQLKWERKRCGLTMSTWQGCIFFKNTPGGGWFSVKWKIGQQKATFFIRIDTFSPEIFPFTQKGGKGKNNIFRENIHPALLRGSNIKKKLI